MTRSALTQSARSYCTQKQLLHAVAITVYFAPTNRAQHEIVVHYPDPEGDTLAYGDLAYAAQLIAWAFLDTRDAAHEKLQRAFADNPSAHLHFNNDSALPFLRDARHPSAYSDVHDSACACDPHEIHDTPLDTSRRPGE